MKLTELQQTIWENCRYESSATQQISTQAYIYYIQYRQHLREIHAFVENQNKIQNLMLIAFFISEKTQLVYDANGNKVSVALSINQLAKKNNDYKELFYHIKQMMRVITIPELVKQSEEQINSFMKYFSFVMTFYNKFLSTFDKISICHNISSKDLEQIGGEKEYQNKIKYLLWAIFISFRKQEFKNAMDTIGNTCLMACTFTYLVYQIYKLQKITAIYAPDIAQDFGTFSNEYTQIQSTFLSFFCLKDYKTYEELRNRFKGFIQSIMKKYPDFKSPFSSKVIQINIKKIIQGYYLNSQIAQMDETLFLKNLISNQENIRFTAFGGKRKVNKFHSNNVVQCKRVLNYETEIKSYEQDQGVKKDQQDNPKSVCNYMKIIKKIKESQTPVILIQATPINQFSTGYNWLYKKSIQGGFDQINLDLEYLLQIGYKEESRQLDNKYILQKRNLIEGLFMQFMKELQQTQEKVNIAIILALEVFYYVMNITNRQIHEIVDALNVSWFSLWEGVDLFLNYDKSMPNHIKTHLILLQTSIISSFIWKQTQLVDSFAEQNLSDQYPQFFFRVLHHLAYQINYIGKSINLPDKAMDQAFLVCQFYLNNRIQSLKNINLDIVIMCAIYGVCRAKNLDIKFKLIKSAYKTVNNIDEKAFEAIETFQHIEEQVETVIDFYNKIFLGNSKSILIKIKEETLQNDEQLNCSNYVLSPIKLILPSQGIPLNKMNTSAQNEILFHYNESPLLSRSKRIKLNKNLFNVEDKNQAAIRSKNSFKQIQVLREKSTNISQILQSKFGSNKSSTLTPKAFLNTKHV